MYARISSLNDTRVPDQQITGQRLRALPLLGLLCGANSLAPLVGPPSTLALPCLTKMLLCRASTACRPRMAPAGCRRTAAPPPSATRRGGGGGGCGKQSSRSKKSPAAPESGALPNEQLQFGFFMHDSGPDDGAGAAVKPASSASKNEASEHRPQEQPPAAQQQQEETQQLSQEPEDDPGTIISNFLNLEDTTPSEISMRIWQAVEVGLQAVEVGLLGGCNSVDRSNVPVAGWLKHYTPHKSVTMPLQVLESIPPGLVAQEAAAHVADIVTCEATLDDNSTFLDRLDYARHGVEYFPDFLDLLLALRRLYAGASATLQRPVTPPVGFSDRILNLQPFYGKYSRNLAEDPDSNMGPGEAAALLLVAAELSGRLPRGGAAAPVSDDPPYWLGDVCQIVAGLAAAQPPTPVTADEALALVNALAAWGPLDRQHERFDDDDDVVRVPCNTLLGETGPWLRVALAQHAADGRLTEGEVRAVFEKMDGL
jgi:hypothetical protein